MSRISRRRGHATRVVPVSKARTILGQLVHELELDPTLEILITHRGRGVARLVAPPLVPDPSIAARAILEALRRAPVPEIACPEDTSERIDRYLFGQWPGRT